MIRNAKKVDLPEIAEMIIQFYTVPPYNEKWTKKTALEKVKDYFKQNKIFVIEEDKKLIGFLVGSFFNWDTGKTAHLDEIIVKPEFRGKGFGIILIKNFEKYAKKVGAVKILLATNKQARAFHLYLRLGYKEDGVTEMEKYL